MPISLYMREGVRPNQREDKFLRATNYKHYEKEQSDKTPNKSSRKALKVTSAGIAVTIAAIAFIVPTTTLAPGVEAFADSRVSSYSVGDIDKFADVIKDNCVEVTTAPFTEAATAAAKAKQEAPAAKPAEKVEKTEAVEVKETKTEEKEEASKSEPKETKSEKAAEVAYEDEDDSYADYSESKESAAAVSYSGATLLDIANPDYSYSPSFVSLSSYDRAKLERLVMGEAGTMSYEGCALVAQSIRDAMNRSGTSSIDQIIYEYQYFGSTDIEPNQKVKDAVSFIFDENGSAVQHRVMCFYIGYSSWHETQNFLAEVDGVRFFDLTF